MSIDIKVVETKKDLKTFVKFPFKIFKGNPYWVPQLILEDMEIFDRDKNPAYEFADTKLFLAYRDGQVVGRIAGIISRIANEKYDTKNLRFGWFDVIEDYQVAEALFKAVEQWGREMGLETLTGPHGFTDLDPEGMLVEGYDRMPTIAVYYNHPYYVDFTGKYGFEKEIDYTEILARPPADGIPPKLLRLAERIKERSSIRLLEFKSKSEIKPIIRGVFGLIEEAFEDLYGTVPISSKQMDYYVKKYYPMVNKNFLKVAVNENDEPVGFLLALPSLSRAFQKAKGRLLPFGWFHILKVAFTKRFETLDFYLAGIAKKYRGRGIDVLMAIEMCQSAIDGGVKYVESNPELETNTLVHAQWKYFNPTNHKRRRIFKKNIPAGDK